MAQPDQATSDVRSIEAKSKQGDNQGAASLAIKDYQEYAKSHSTQDTANYWKDVSGQLKADGILPDLAIGYGQANWQNLTNDNGNLSTTQLRDYAQGLFPDTPAEQLFAQTLLNNYSGLKNADTTDGANGQNNSEVTGSDLNNGTAYLQGQEKVQADVTSWLSGPNPQNTLLARVDRDGGHGNTHDGNVDKNDVENALKNHPNDFTDQEKAFLQAQVANWNNNPLVEKGNLNGNSLTDAYNNASGDNKSFQDVLAMSQPHVVAGTDPSHPNEIVYPDGSTRSFQYDASGNISQITETAVGVGSTTYRNDGQGWGPVQADGTVKPNGAFAPTIDSNGNYTYYTTKDGVVTVHSQSADFGGKSYEAGNGNAWDTVNLPKGSVIPGVTDASGNPLPADQTPAPAAPATPGQPATPGTTAGDVPPQGTKSQIGNLTVTSNGDGTYSYTVASGDTLTAIASQIAQADHLDPNKVLQDIENANKSSITDPNVIDVGETVIIPSEQAS